LLKECKIAKEAKYGKNNNHSGKGLKAGGLLSLFRYPEDIALDEGKKKTDEKTGTKKLGNRGKRDEYCNALFNRRRAI
jgi:hypothetical protein